MSATAEVDLTRENAKSISALSKTVDGLVKKLGSMPAPGTPPPYQVFGPPWARTGEDPLTSRGFSFMKMLGMVLGIVPQDQCKIERDVHNRLHKCLHENPGSSGGYEYGGGYTPGDKTFLAPLATGYLHDNFVDRAFRQEMKALVAAGTDGADYDEMKWIKQHQLKSMGYGQKALSWLNELSGGALVAPPEMGELIELLRNKEALVAPPEMGELIELLRNKEALVNAGARTVPLPPQGRIKYPRQTMASTTYWIGENFPIPESEIGTGEITLQAKKLAVLIKSPNELIRFASPAAEALIRDDMTKSLALALDLAGLEGAGGDHRPRGVLNLPGITTLTSSSTGANGDKIVAQDIYRMVAAVEEANAEFEGYIMRPKTLYKYYQLRFDATASGDSGGGFLFSLIREAADGMGKAALAGFPVTKSTQVSQVRSKGSASNLTYILGGMWSDLLIGMFGAIEFSATNAGDSAFIRDQTWVKGILSADIAARHEAAFVLLDNLSTTL